MTSKPNPKWKLRKEEIRKSRGQSIDLSSAGGGGPGFSFPVVSQKQRSQHSHFENILFPEGYTYASIKRIDVPPFRHKSDGDKRNEDDLIIFNSFIENHRTPDGAETWTYSGRSNWFWRIDSSDWSPIPSLTRTTQTKQGQENMDRFKVLLKNRGEFLIYATKWSDPIHYPHSYNWTSYSNGNELFEFLAGVRIGITNFGNLIVNFKNGTFPSDKARNGEEQTRINRHIEIYEIRQTPFPTEGEKIQFNHILESVIIPFLNWTSQIKPIYRGGVLNFGFSYSIIRCPFETILPLLVSFLMCPLSVETDGKHQRRKLKSTHPSRMDFSQLLLKQIGLFQKQIDLNQKQKDLDKRKRLLTQKQEGVTQRQTTLSVRQGTLDQKQRGLDQRERIIRQTQEQFRKRKKHKVVTEAELAELLSSYPILNQEKVKNRVRRYFSGRFGSKSLFDLFLDNYFSPLFLFHGTDSSSRKRIQDQGIRTDVATNVVYGPGFYLTTNPEEALRYAESRFRERRRTRRCMSPILLVFKISPENAMDWILKEDFNLKETPPYYIVCQNQEKLKDLEMVDMIFLEERCF